MKTHAALALLLCGFSAIAQTEKPKKPPPVPPPLPPMAYALEGAFGGLTFSQPLAIVSAPGETDRIFVVEKTGCIQAVTQLDQPTPAKHVFANLTERPDGRLDDKGECGLLGLAFHPGFARNGWVYMYFSPAGPPAKNVLARFTMKGDSIDLTSQRVMLEIPVQRDSICRCRTT